MTKSDIKDTSTKQRNEIKKACLENARWLLKQAETQFSAGNYNLSTFLAITAYEESLKYGLLNFHQFKLISDEELNNLLSHHNEKLLSKYAVIQMSLEGEKVEQKYILPKKSEYFTKIVQGIITKRGKALYVDYKDSTLNIPTKMSPSDATEEMNRAYKSIQNETVMELLDKRAKKSLRQVKMDIVGKPIIPKPNV